MIRNLIKGSDRGKGTHVRLPASHVSATIPPEFRSVPRRIFRPAMACSASLPIGPPPGSHPAMTIAGPRARVASPG